MRDWKTAFVRFWRDEDGPTAVEYAVMLALIVVVCIGAVQALTVATEGSFQSTSDAIDSAINGQ